MELPAGMASAEVLSRPEGPAAGVVGAETNQPSHQQDTSKQPGTFVNQGLIAWQQQRREWIQKPPDLKQSKKRSYSGSVTPDQVLSFEPFPRPVPLEEVIEALCEVWDAEEC